MNFDYHGIGSTGSRRIPVQAIELATNIITDWMQGPLIPFPEVSSTCLIMLLPLTL